MRRVAEHCTDLKNIDRCPICGSRAIRMTGSCRDDRDPVWMLLFFCHDCEGAYPRGPVTSELKAEIARKHLSEEGCASEQADKEMMRDEEELARSREKGEELTLEMMFQELARR